LKASLQSAGEPPVPIVANKPAVLRTYISTIDTTVQLKAVATFEGIDNPPPSVTQPLVASCTPQDQRRQAAACRSYDFYFTPPKGGWKVTIDLFVASGAQVDTTTPLSFFSRQTRPVSIIGLPVCDQDLKDGMGSWGCTSWPAIPDISLLRKIVPTDEVRSLQVYTPIQLSTAPYIVPGNNQKTGANVDNGWWWALLQKIENLYLGYPVYGNADSWPVYYGMVRPVDPISQGVILGMTKQIPGHVAAGRTSWAIWGQYVGDGIVAHETGHALGRRHTNSDVPHTSGFPGCYLFAYDPGTDWLAKGAYIGQPPNGFGVGGDTFLHGSKQIEVGFDVEGRAAVPPDGPGEHLELMSYCTPLWISAVTYKKELSALSTGPSSLVTSSAAPRLRRKIASGSFWTVSGTIGDSGVAFDPLFQGVLNGSNDGGNGSYRMEVQDASGAVLFTRYFMPANPPPEIADAVQATSFDELVPVTPGAAQLVVFDPNNGQLGALAFGGTPPTVTLLAPGGGNVAGPQTISWSIDDPDSTQFATKVFYSADSGATWTPLGEVPGTVGVNSLAVDFDSLPGSQSASIMLWVSDGINTTQLVTDPFTVPRKSNILVQIVSPAPNSVFKRGEFVSLNANAYDFDDGTLDDSAITWQSNIDGPLGTGARLNITTLKPGQHQITMTATDSDGNSAVQTVTIRVADQAPSISLTLTPAAAAPATCMQASVKAIAGSVELAKTEYSLDGGITWLAVPPAGTFIVPGSGALDVIARTFDVAGQLAADEIEASTTGPCQLPH
jgi:hypothetical protein